MGTRFGQPHQLADGGGYFLFVSRYWNDRLETELGAQQTRFDDQRKAMIEEAICELRKALRAEFTLAKEREVALALRQARVSAKRPNATWRIYELGPYVFIGFLGFPVVNRSD